MEGYQQLETHQSFLYASQIANMDLWAPVKDSNEYGARNKKNVSQHNTEE